MFTLPERSERNAGSITLTSLAVKIISSFIRTGKVAEGGKKESNRHSVALGCRSVDRTGLWRTGRKEIATISEFASFDTTEAHRSAVQAVRKWVKLDEWKPEGL